MAARKRRIKYPQPQQEQRDQPMPQGEPETPHIPDEGPSITKEELRQLYRRGLPTLVFGDSTVCLVKGGEIVKRVHLINGWTKEMAEALREHELRTFKTEVSTHAMYSMRRVLEDMEMRARLDSSNNAGLPRNPAAYLIEEK